ncbi:MAG: hypothetical protein PVI54_15350 [Desulfobacteraceae bacterium]|jgi:hypothetical protein
MRSTPWHNHCTHNLAINAIEAFVKSVVEQYLKADISGLHSTLPMNCETGIVSRRVVIPLGPSMG